MWRWPASTPPFPTALPMLLREELRSQWGQLLFTASSGPGEASRAGGSRPVAMVTVSLLTHAAGDGGPVAPDAHVQEAGLLGQPGLRAGSIRSPRSPGLLGALLLVRRGSPEAGPSLLGFLPDGGWGRVLWGHFSLRALKL